MGFGGQEWDRITLHCGTTRVSSHDVPELLPQPCLSCTSVQEGGEGGDTGQEGHPQRSHLPFAKHPHDLF